MTEGEREKTNGEIEKKRERESERQILRYSGRERDESRNRRKIYS